MAKLGKLIFEVVEEETVDFTNNLISKPIEDRNEISDHITHQPVTVNIKFVVSALNSKDTYDTLIEMHNSNQVYDYNGVHGFYNNMAIKSLSVPRNSKIVEGFQGSLKLQQIRIVEQQSIQRALGKDPVTENQAQSDSKQAEKRSTKEDNIQKT
jgi:hypothetical protein